MPTKNGADGQESFIEAARRQQIIDCAIETIVELGYGGASLSAIAKRARLSKSAIAYYFASKDELLEQVVVNLYENGYRFMAEKLEGEASAAAALETYIRRNCDFIAANTRHIHAVGEVVTNLRKADGSPHWDASSGDWMIDSVEALLLWGVKAGEFRRMNARVVASSLRAAIDAFGVQLLVHPETDAAAYTAELAEIYRRATTSGALAPAPPARRTPTTRAASQGGI